MPERAREITRFFGDPAQIDGTALSVRNKLERMAAPLARVEGQPEWSLTPHVQGAVDLLQEAATHGIKNLDDVVRLKDKYGR